MTNLMNSRLQFATSEAANSTFNLSTRTETFPEPRGNPHQRFVRRLPGQWLHQQPVHAADQRGRHRETPNHRTAGIVLWLMVTPCLANDTNLSDTTNSAFHANTREIGQTAALFICARPHTVATMRLLRANSGRFTQSDRDLKRRAINVSARIDGGYCALRCATARSGRGATTTRRRL